MRVRTFLGSTARLGAAVAVGLGALFGVSLVANPAALAASGSCQLAPVAAAFYPRDRAFVGFRRGQHHRGEPLFVRIGSR
jgi:hypothetical protein